MNVFGLLTGVTALFIIGMGFIWVIRGERHFGYLWWPYVLGLGVLLVSLSLWIDSDWASTLTGLLGASFIWGSTELKEQAVRAELGWYPFKKKKIMPPGENIIRKWKPPHL